MHKGDHCAIQAIKNKSTMLKYNQRGGMVEHKSGKEAHLGTCPMSTVKKFTDEP